MECDKKNITLIILDSDEEEQDIKNQDFDSFKLSEKRPIECKKEVQIVKKTKTENDLEEEEFSADSPITESDESVEIKNEKSLETKNDNNSETKSDNDTKSDDESKELDDSWLNESVSFPSTSKSGKKEILNDGLIYLEEPKEVFRHQFMAVKKEISARDYVLHECSPRCLPSRRLPNLSHLNLLAKPLLSFWDRQIAKSQDSKDVFVHYKAPCGRRLRNLSEIKKYLKITGCEYLDMEHFDFNEDIQVMLSYIVKDKSTCPFYHPDISKGKEAFEIPAINAFDNIPPPKFEYTTKSIPMDGVYINEDPEFLFCCDCEDDCADKTKCDCFKATIENFSYGEDVSGQDVNWVSYEWKRLLYLVETGIFECNSRCKCSKKCLNRVAQNPSQVKVQVFRTSDRGWGVQARHDIAAGSFICTYEGQVYSEEHAEMLSDLKDDCFAQLDLMENISEAKEGFEKDAKEDFDEEVTLTPAQEYRKHIKSAGRVYLIDGKRQGNIGRFFNHSCDPNLFVQSVFLRTHDLRFPSLALFACGPIKAGEELTWDYGYEIGLSETKVLYCKCGSEGCKGRIL